MEKIKVPVNMKKNMVAFLGLHSKAMVLMNVVLTLFGAFIGTYFIGFVNTLKAHSAELIVLLVILVLDWVTGTMVAIKNKKFETRKAMRSPLQIVGYMIIAVCTYEIQKVYPLLKFLEAAVLLPIVVFNFISIMKNMALLEWVKAGLIIKILDNIDSHKDKFLGKGNKPDEETNTNTDSSNLPPTQ